MEGAQAAQHLPPSAQNQACTPIIVATGETAVAAHLAELGKLAGGGIGDRQKLWTAALEMRLNQLAAERRSREAAAEAIMEAKQRELDWWLQHEQSMAAEVQDSPAPAGVLDAHAQPSPLASPISHSG